MKLSELLAVITSKVNDLIDAINAMQAHIGESSTTDLSTIEGRLKALEQADSGTSSSAVLRIENRLPIVNNTITLSYVPKGDIFAQLFDVAPDGTPLYIGTLENENLAIDAQNKTITLIGTPILDAYKLTVIYLSDAV
jgi:hypothetical protein